MHTFMRHRAAGLGQRGRGLACLAVAAAVAMLAADPAAAQTTWSGTPASGLWNLGSNWASGTAPAASGTLAFGTSTITTTTNNFAAGTAFNGITFLAGAPAYTLSGSSFALGTANVTNNSTNLQTFRLNMTAVGSQARTFTMTDGGGDIELAGSYSDMGFTLSGTGTLILSGSLRGNNSNRVQINANTTLRVSSPGSLPQVGESTNGQTDLNGGTLDLRNDVGQDFSNVRMNLGSGTNVFINVDRAVGGTGSNQTMTIGNLTKTGNYTNNAVNLRVTGSNGYGLTTGTLTYGNVGNASTFQITNNAPGQLTMAGFGFDPGVFTNYSTMTLGGTGGSMSIGGLRSTNQSVSASGTFGIGSYAVVKSNTITAIITGSSTYAGTTTVQAGTLRSTANAGLGGAGIARELSRAIGTVTVTGSTAASAVDFSGVTANNVIALSGSTFGASLLNSNAATPTTLDNGVAGITFSNGGSGFTLANLNADGVISVSSGGAAAQITSLGGSLGTVTITNGGSGYAIGNYIQLTGGNATNNANFYITYQVSGTGAGGSITAVSLFRAGNGYTGLPTAFTTGTGISSGATVGTVVGTGLALSYNDNFAVAGIRTTALGTDYTTAPTITTTSGSGLVATANVSSVSLTGTNNSIGGAGAMTIKSAISGASGGFTKAGAGRLTLSASNSYTGATRISEGILEIGSTGRINGSSGITIAGATAEFKYNSATALTQPITFTQGTISGTGSIATAVTVGTNNVISPGNSPGIQSYTSGLTWASGGMYVWEINDWTGVAGTAFDQVAVSGSPLVISSSSSSPFTIRITGLTGSNAVGAVPNFDNSARKTFTIATSGSLTNFAADKFTLDSTTSFTGANGLNNGGFTIGSSGNNVVLTYIPSARYTLTGSAAATAIRTGSSTTLTATIASSTASVTNPDSLGYTGLSLLGGAGTLNSTSGTLAGGASGSGNVSYSNNTAGAYTFTPTLTSGSNVNIGTTAIATATTGVTVNVYNPAANSFSGTTVMLANVRVGGTFGTQNLTIGNTATAAVGFQEGLSASLSGSTGQATAAGSIANLITGTDNSSITVGLGGNANTATAGVRSGTVTLGFTSTGTTSTGATGLTPLSLGSQTVAVTGTVFNMAAANTIATPINIGNVYVGGTFGTSALTISNTAPGGSFTEGLNASFGSATGAASNNSGSFTNLAAGQTNSSSLVVGLGSASTATAGAVSGTQVITLASSGINSGLSDASLSSQTLSITGAVWNPAAVNTLSAVTLGNVRVGGTFGSSSLSIQNTAAGGAYTEVLGASATTSGLASSSGSVTALAGGSTSTAISLGLGGSANTATAGLKSGSATIAFTSTGGPGTASINSQTVAVTGTVFNAAAANTLSTPIDLGTVLKGTSLSQALSITNTAPNTYSEKLDATFGSLTGDASTNTGSISLLAAGGTSTAMSVGLDSLTAGSKSGSVQVNFASNGDGTSGLAPLALDPQTVSLTATVLDPAVASFTSGPAASTTLSLNFLTVNEGDSLSKGFSLFNLLQTAGYTADLALTNIISSNPTGPFSTNLTQFSNLASGSTNSWQVFLNAGGQGTFSNTWTLQFKSANANTVYSGDSTQTLTLSANVIVVPEPGAIALAGIGIAAAGYALRRRKPLAAARG